MNNKVKILIENSERKLFDEGNFLIALMDKTTDKEDEHELSFHVLGLSSTPSVASILSDAVIQIAKNNPGEDKFREHDEIFILTIVKEEISKRLNDVDPIGEIRELIKEISKNNQEENDNE